MTADRTGHRIRIRWHEQPPQVTSYWADCSCNWETAFESTDQDVVKEMAKEHAKRVQAHAVEREGQYV